MRKLRGSEVNSIEIRNKVMCTVVLEWDVQWQKVLAVALSCEVRNDAASPTVGACATYTVDTGL